MAIVFKSPILQCLAHGDKKILKCMKACDFYYDEIYDGEGWTALDVACCSGNIELVDLFLDHPNLKINKDLLLLSKVAARGHINIIERLFKISYYRNSVITRALALYSAAKHGNLHIVDLILHTASVDKKIHNVIGSSNDEEVSPFAAAAQNNHFKIMYRLALLQWPRGPNEMPKQFLKYLPGIMKGQRMLTDCAGFDENDYTQLSRTIAYEQHLSPCSTEKNRKPKLYRKLTLPST
ncbi:MAG: hypothetical protein HOL58_09940 [Francisellaceae bacterium]|nr:hypothetical protein [Francisellaceae bacterium]